MRISHKNSMVIIVLDDYFEIKKIFPRIEGFGSEIAYSFSKSDIKKVKAELAVLEISPEIKKWLQDYDPSPGNTIKWEWVTWLNIDQYMIYYNCQITINDPKLASLFRLIWL